MEGTVTVVALAALGSLAVALPGLLVLHLSRRRPLTLLLPMTALVGVLTVAAGVAVSSRAMFTAKSDLLVLIPVLLVAGAVSLAGALWAAFWVRASSRAIASELSALSPTRTRIDGPAELRDLGAELVAGRAELAESHDREQALETSRRDLVAWVSHDLRTPLAGLRAMTEALEDGVVADAADVRRYYATMGRELDGLAALVDDLFELSRIHAGAVRSAVQRVGMGDLVSDALASADPLARDRNVHLTGIGAEGLPTVEVSVPEVGRALRNLLVNAIHHTPSDGSVVVAGRSDDSSVYLAVHDSCGGIPETDLPRIFDVAFRGQSARTPGADAGAGLGLAIARGIVEAHDGELSVANEGAGCRFLIRLPVAYGPTRQDPTPVPSRTLDTG